MHARVTKEELGLMLPHQPSRSAQQIEQLQFAAIHAREAEFARTVRGAGGVLARAFALPSTLLHRLGAWQNRQRVLNELRELSDRDLADIGLSRSDLGRHARLDSIRRQN